MPEELETWNEILTLLDYCYWNGIEELNREYGIMSELKEVEVGIVELERLTSVGCYL